MPVPLTSRQTIDLAAAALSSGRGAGLPELLELIQTLTGRIDRVSLAELADVIEQDPVVAARLISMANLIAHNPGMSTLASVTHAIHQIGFQRVRGLAISLLLLKSTGAREHAAEQRQAASRALCAGLLAQACARQTPAVDAELVFACATLRQLGRILLPVVSVEHFRAATQEAAEIGEDAAFRAHFGLTSLELSRELLKSYSLPPDVKDALGDAPQAEAGISDHAARMIGFAEFGRRLSDAVLDVELDQTGYERATAELTERFHGVAPGIGDALATALDFTGERLAQFAQLPGASTYPDIMLRRIRSRQPRPVETATVSVPPAAPLEVAAPAPQPEPTPLFSTAPFPVPAVPAAASAAAPKSTDSLAPESLPDAITLVPEPVRAATPTDPWQQVLRPVCDGFAATDCAVFLRSAVQGPFILTEGIGRFATHNLDLAAVHAADRNVFSIALTRREAVVIHDARTPTLQAYLPQWFTLAPETPASFLLVPLTLNQGVEGLVLVGWTAQRHVDLGPSQEALLHLLRTSAEPLLRQRGDMLRARSA